MRWISMLVIVFAMSNRVGAQTQVSVKQLEDDLFSESVSKETDSEIAHRLALFQLSEQLTDSRLEEICARGKLGPKARDQLGLLAILSVFEPPPSAELDLGHAPDLDEQRRIMDLARGFTATSVHLLPDFMAIRTTQAFLNMDAGLQSAGQYQSQVTFRSGAEVPVDRGTALGSGSPSSMGLETSGEFGPLQAMVLKDSVNGTILWSRWQSGPDQKRFAVFRYSVPESASHASLDVCCYFASLEDGEMTGYPPHYPQSKRFRAKPAYHGELHVDPSTGAISRITLEDELNADSPVRVARISVQYGSIEIGGKSYVCPIHSVAAAEFYDPRVAATRERFVNVVHFSNYHKFGSTARIIDAR